MASKMAGQAKTSTMQTSTKDPVDEMMDNMRKLRDGKLPIVDRCYTVADLLGSEVKATINAAVETAENFMGNGKCDVINERLDQFNAFTCVSASFALVKSFQNLVLDLDKEVNVEEHNQRIAQIRKILGNVEDKLKDISGKIEAMGVVLTKKILLYDSTKNPGIYIEFDLNFDLITKELNACHGLLKKAKKDLAKGFSSVKEYLINCVATHVAAGVAIAVPAAVIMVAAAIYLLPVIGCCLTIGVIAVKGAVGLDALGRIAYNLVSSIKAALGIREEYKHLEGEMKYLATQLKELQKKMKIYGNARKRHEAENKNIIFETEKIQDQKKIQRLEAEKIQDREEIKRLREQLAAKNCK